jgi:hypothetical protein
VRAAKTDKIQGDPAQPNRGRSFRAGAKAFRTQALENETVNGLANPRIGGIRDRRPNRRHKRPVLGVFAAFFDPAF